MILRGKGLCTGLAVGLAAGMMLVSVVAQTEKTDRDAWKEKFFEPLAWTVSQVQARYVDEVDPERTLIGAYRGILDTLDEYSVYIPTDRLEEFEGDTRGEFGGLGISIRFLPLEKVLRVEQPIPGTPAFRLGILSGDIITRVREESTGKVYETNQFRDVHDAVRILRGEPGTKVTVTVFHEGSHEQEDITVERAIIKIPGIRAAHMLDERWGIGYTYVPAFHESTAEDLKKAVQTLQTEGLKALIVDLRFNPGGLLSSAVDVSDLFLSDSVVVSTRGRTSPEFVFRTQTHDILNGVPLVVLVNRHSASASEIVAGAVKDNARGLVIGETTYGKGSVQTIIPLKDKRSAIKLTTARYYTPSGVCIQNKGVEPDVKVELTDEEMRALAREIAETADYSTAIEETPEQPQTPAVEPTPQEQESAGEETPFRDIQLERAVYILTGILVEQQRHQPAQKAEENPLPH